MHARISHACARARIHATRHAALQMCRQACKRVCMHACARACTRGCVCIYVRVRDESAGSACMVGVWVGMKGTPVQQGIWKENLGGNGYKNLAGLQSGPVKIKKNGEMRGGHKTGLSSFSYRNQRILEWMEAIKEPSSRTSWTPAEGTAIKNREARVGNFPDFPSVFRCLVVLPALHRGWRDSGGGRRHSSGLSPRAAYIWAAYG